MPNNGDEFRFEDVTDTEDDDDNDEDEDDDEDDENAARNQYVLGVQRLPPFWISYISVSYSLLIHS